MPRTPTARLLTLLAVPIREASAKVRIGGASDEPEDADLEIWAGVVELRTAAGPVHSDADVQAGLQPPPYATAYRRPGWSAQGTMTW